MSLAAWLLNLLADINALVLDTFVGEAALVASISQESLVSGTSWYLHAESTSVVAADDTVFETRASVASVLKMVPLFAQSSSASGLIDTLWWWGWGGWTWGTWSSGGNNTLTLGNHLLASWAAAHVLAGPLSPRYWSTAWLAGTLISASGWRIALADLLVAWLAITEVVTNDGVDLHGWTLTSDILLWWASDWVTNSLVAASNSVVRIVGGIAFFASGKFLNASSALTGVAAGVLMELELTVDESTDVPALLTDSRVVNFVDDGGKWNDASVELASLWWWSARL